MLQTMRDNMKGTIALIIVGFLAFILAASLVNLGGSSAGHRDATVATVDGATITEQQVQIALAQERQRLQSRFGDSLPAEFLTDERLRQPVLQGLIQRNILLQQAQDGDMTIDDAALDQLITQMPQFQTGGVFDQQLFVYNVRRIGHTPLSFRALLRDDIVVNQLRNAMTASAFVSATEVRRLLALTRQTRDFSWITLPLDNLSETLTITDEEIAAHYANNKSRYNTEEKVAIEYLELKVSDIAATLDVSEDDIQQQYQSELETFAGVARREAAHIMITDGDDANATIAEVRQKLAAGEDFATLAATYSDDPGTNNDGGLLGTTTGDAFPPAFEETLATLAVGQVSEPVAIDGATHFIKLISVVAATPPDFDGSKERIANEIKNLRAETIYLEKLDAMKDLAYNAETLAEVAEPLSLAVAQTDFFSRSGGAEPVLSDGRVVTAAFSEQVLQQGFTSDVLELEPGSSVVINLIEHQPVRVLSLEEKTADIVTELTREKAKARLAEQAETLEQALRGGTSLADLAAENNLSVNAESQVNRDGRDQPAELLAHVFSLPRPVADTPVISSLYLASDDYALIALTAVNDAVYDELTEEEQRNARLSIERSSAAAEFSAWQAFLEDKADIEISGR